MSRSRKALFAAVVVLLAFGLAEGALRLAGFRYQRVTTYLEFNYPRPGFLKAFFELDPDLLYRIRSTVKQRYVDLTWQPHFDLKIRDHRTFGPKPPGTLRIATVGDSSTYGVNTEKPWPTRLQGLFDRTPGLAGRVEVLNLGVPGYTAFQGRRVLETRGDRIDPDVVVIYFGWNDHLLALGYSDAEQKVGGAPVVATRNLVSGSRVYQGMSWLVATLRGEPATATPVAAEGGDHPAGLPAGGPGELNLHFKRRVGPDTFREDLTAMATLARDQGATAALCTYPTALSHLVETGLPGPEWLAETHVGAGTAREVLELQELYNRTVRQVAAETGALLIDLEAAFTREGKARLFVDPAGDMIHPSEPGYELVAALIYQALGEAGGLGGRGR